MNPDQPNLDQLADALSQLTEAEATAVIRKARGKDAATRQQAAANAVKQYLSHGPRS
jgi:hypothetical protein